MKRILDAIDGLLVRCGILLTILLMLAVVADATARYLIGRSLMGVYEFTSDYLVVLIVFSSVSFAYTQGSFVRITVLLDAMPERVRRAVDLAMQLLAPVVVAFLAYAAFRQFLRIFEDGTMSNSRVQYPLWPAYLAVFVGVAMLFLRVVLSIGRQVQPDHARADAGEM